LIVAAAIAVLQVVQSSGFAHTGQTLQRLETERVDAGARVHQLEAEVAALSSLDRVERQARDRLGMVAPLSTTYVEVGVPAPEGPLLPRPILKPLPDPAVESKPWWKRLLNGIAAVIE
jgi:cell division protein FtsL